jgi:HEAT repeat protein
LKGGLGPSREGFQHFAGAFHAAWHNESDAPFLLGHAVDDPQTPGIARATALSELSPYVSPDNLRLAQTALTDPDPMVRIGALDTLEGAPSDELWGLASPLLGDQDRGVRIRAASLLATIPAERQPQSDRARFARAAAQFVAAAAPQRRSAGSSNEPSELSSPARG